MTNSKLLVRFLNIRSSELHKVLTLSSHAFFSGLGISLAFSAINLLLIKKHGTEFLPIIYMVAMVFLLLTGRIYSKLEHKLPPAKLFSHVVLAMAIWAVISFFCIGEGAFWMTAALYCSYFVIYLLNNLEFWGASALLFDVRQSKRVFGFLNSGESLAKIIGYSLTPLIVTVLDESYLLLAAGVAFVISGIFWRRITKVYHQSFHIDHNHNVQFIESESNRQSATDQLIRRASYLALFGVVVITIVEFAFLNKVEKSFDSATQVAFYFGAFFGTSKFINLILELTVSGRVIESWGLKRSVIMLPFAILFFALLAIAFGNMSFFDAEGYFVIFVLMMMADVVLYSAIHKPAFMSIFQPLSKESRLAAHTLVKGITEPIGVGIGGFVLWILIYTGVFNFTILAISIALFSILWIITGFDTSKVYGDLVEKMMKSRLLNQDTLPTLLNNIDEIEKSILQKDDPFNKLYLLQLSGGRISKKFCTDTSQSLLKEEYSEDLLVATLRYIEENHLEGSDVSHLLKHDNRSVSEAAIRTFSSLEQENCVDQLLEMADSDRKIRVVAFASLLKNGGLFAATQIGHHVLNWQSSDDPQDRMNACEVIGNTGIKSYFQPLLTLLDDDDVRVRKAAILAAGQVQHSKLIPSLLDDALKPGFFDNVFRSIQNFAPQDFPLIARRLTTEDDLENKRKLIRLLSANPGTSEKEIVDVLYKLFSHHSPMIRNEVINTLFLIHADYKDSDLLNEEWNKECQSIDHLQKNWLTSSESKTLLADTIQEEIDNKIIGLLKLTGLLYQKRLLLKAIDNYQLGNAVELSNTLEALDLILGKSHRKRLMYVLEHDVGEHGGRKPDSNKIDLILMDKNGLFSDWLKAVIIRTLFHPSPDDLKSSWRRSLKDLHSTIIDQELAFITSVN